MHTCIHHSVTYYEREREREGGGRQTDRQTDRQRQTDRRGTDRQTDRQTENFNIKGRWFSDFTVRYVYRERLISVLKSRLTPFRLVG